MPLRNSIPVSLGGHEAVVYRCWKATGWNWDMSPARQDSFDDHLTIIANSDFAPADFDEIINDRHRSCFDQLRVIPTGGQRHAIYFCRACVIAHVFVAR